MRRLFSAGGQSISQFRIYEDELGICLALSGRIVGTVNQITTPCDVIATTDDLHRRIEGTLYTNSVHFGRKVTMKTWPRVSHEVHFKSTLSRIKNVLRRLTQLGVGRMLGFKII